MRVSIKGKIESSICIQKQLSKRKLKLKDQIVKRTQMLKNKT